MNTDSDDQNHVVKSPGSRHRCRRVGTQRRGSVRRVQQSTRSSILSSSTFLLGLAGISAMMCPVSAASLHQPNHNVGFKTRRERRASGERNIRSIVRNNPIKKGKKFLKQRSVSSEVFVRHGNESIHLVAQSGMIIALLSPCLDCNSGFLSAIIS